MLSTTAAGLSVARAQRRSSARLVRRCCAVGHAEGSQESREVRLDEVDGEGFAEGVALVLAQDPVAAVVDDEELRAEPVLASARELPDPVEEAAVADHGQRRPAGRRRRTERRRPGVAERARAERVEEAPRLECGEVGRGPVGEDGHVPGADGIPRECGADRLEEAALELVALLPEAAVDPLPGLAGEALAAGLPLRHRVDKRAEDGLGVADERERVVGRADPLGRDVDLDDATGRAERVLAGGLGAELGADAEEDVRGAHGLLERALVTGRAERERVVVGERALAHVGRGDRRAEPLCEGANLVPGAGAEDAASGPDHGLLGRSQECGGLRHVGQRRLGGRAVQLVDARQVGLAGQQVDGDLEEDRSCRRARGATPGLGEQLRDLVWPSLRAPST